MTERSNQPERHLLVAIHDVGPRFAAEVEQLRALLARRMPDERIAMLVVPNHWGEAPILPGSAFAAQLRDWAEAGSEIFLHGWFHRDLARHCGLAGFKARHMTAGEGEFLGLDRSEALRRMHAGRALIEAVIERPVAGFVAPAWLYGAPALSAAKALGFPICEDHLKVWEPASGRILSRSPVICWASRSRPRILSSIAAAFLLRKALRPARVVRLAVHPGDVRIPALLRSIERSLDELLRDREPARYGDLGGLASLGRPAMRASAGLSGAAR